MALLRTQHDRFRRATVCEPRGNDVPLDTERGYQITLAWPECSTPSYPTGRISHPIASTERNVIMTPMAIGLRMTGTVEFGGLRLPPDERRFALLRKQMEALVPGTRADQASSWMGFRPSLPDHLPVIGAAPRHRGVFFAFGHQHLGLTLAGVTARLVADLVQAAHQRSIWRPTVWNGFRRGGPDPLERR